MLVVFVIFVFLLFFGGGAHALIWTQPNRRSYVYIPPHPKPKPWFCWFVLVFVLISCHFFFLVSLLFSGGGGRCVKPGHSQVPCCSDSMAATRSRILPTCSTWKSRRGNTSWTWRSRTPAWWLPSCWHFQRVNRDTRYGLQ